jgi:hypothetical protein
LTTVLEKLKALDAQRTQLLDEAKKEALDNAERAVAELNELPLRAHQRHYPHEHRVKLPHKP